MTISIFSVYNLFFMVYTWYTSASFFIATAWVRETDRSFWSVDKGWLFILVTKLQSSWPECHLEDEKFEGITFGITVWVEPFKTGHGSVCLDYWVYLLIPPSHYYNINRALLHLNHSSTKLIGRVGFLIVTGKF